MARVLHALQQHTRPRLRQEPGTIPLEGEELELRSVFPRFVKGLIFSINADERGHP